MDYSGITKLVLDVQKLTFSNWHNTMAIIQDQTTSVMDFVLAKNKWLPENGRKAVQGWLNACQKERNHFKQYVDEGFSSMEKYIAKSK